MIGPTEQAEASQAALMAQQQKLANCACRYPFAFDAPLLETLGMFNPSTAEPRQASLTSSHVPSFESSPASGTLHNSAGTGDSIFPFEVRAGQFFMLDSPPDPTGSTNASAQLKDDIISSPMVTELDPTAPLSLPPFPVDVDGHSSNVASVDPIPVRSNHPRLPSLRDVQEWTWSTSSEPDRGGSAPDDRSDEEVERLLQEFISLDSVTESAQYNIIGVADTVAMYSSYFRQWSADGKHNVEGLMKFLETLEQRMREISEIASEQVLAQARRAREAVGAYDTYRDRMKELEEEHRRRAQARSDFFRARYDLSSPLSQQV
ncbi:hypothetical protein DL764_002910 [Monosporascus ibericus]|uniref:Uncharacterized protein n=1 Tax=Monosporascus ibericus TaxID=155417 RepID=A0A4Q4TKF8_9PEZI|nr:hypothetical protein DL764_002910 [Monosporascus ibericus]